MVKVNALMYNSHTINKYVIKEESGGPSNY